MIMKGERRAALIIKSNFFIASSHRMLFCSFANELIVLMDQTLGWMRIIDGRLKF